MHCYLLQVTPNLFLPYVRSSIVDQSSSGKPIKHNTTYTMDLLGILLTALAILAALAGLEVITLKH